mmetsp:Transcript_17233/g.43012  ORF Transcript_17233/g.43012 Transcript_17233/m.43012 type:complete len:85 (-) Transcript_17233:564-818(-)
MTPLFILSTYGSPSILSSTLNDYDALLPLPFIPALEIRQSIRAPISSTLSTLEQITLRLHCEYADSNNTYDDDSNFSRSLRHPT